MPYIKKQVREGYYEIIDEMACETKSLIESISEVKFVKSLAGVMCWIYA